MPDKTDPFATPFPVVSVLPVPYTLLLSSCFVQFVPHMTYLSTYRFTPHYSITFSSCSFRHKDFLHFLLLRCFEVNPLKPCDSLTSLVDVDPLISVFTSPSLLVGPNCLSQTAHNVGLGLLVPLFSWSYSPDRNFTSHTHTTVSYSVASCSLLLAPTGASSPSFQ